VPVCRLARDDAAPSPVPSHRPRRYPSDTTDAEWALLEPLLPPPASGHGHGGRPEAHHRRDIVDAIRYVVHNGCVWRRCPVTSRPGAPCTGSTGVGTPAVPPPGCTTGSARRSGWPRAATPSQLRRSTHNRCGPLTPSRRPAAALTPPRRSTGENATWRWTPWGCCWRSWSPPPASKTRRRPVAAVAAAPWLSRRPAPAAWMDAASRPVLGCHLWTA
jgi:Putative transposase of IS4/5 family (DUF4096)